MIYVRGMDASIFVIFMGVPLSLTLRHGFEWGSTRNQDTGIPGSYLFTVCVENEFDNKSNIWGNHLSNPWLRSMKLLLLPRHFSLIVIGEHKITDNSFFLFPDFHQFIHWTPRFWLGRQLCNYFSKSKVGSLHWTQLPGNIQPAKSRWLPDQRRPWSSQWYHQKHTTSLITAKVIKKFRL